MKFKKKKLKSYLIGFLSIIILAGIIFLVYQNYSGEITGDSIITPSKKILVLVNYDLYPQITSSLKQFSIDLNKEGYPVKILRLSSNVSPKNVRDTIKKEYSKSLEGVF